MECKDIQGKLSASIEEVIPPGEKKDLEDHLKGCASCRVALEDLKKAKALLHDLQGVEPPAWLKKKIMLRIREEEKRKGGILQKLFHPLHIKVPLQAMATVFIAVIAIYLFHSMEPEVQKMQAPLVTKPAAPGHEDLPKPRPPAAVPIPEAERAQPSSLQETNHKAKDPRGIFRVKEGEQAPPREEDPKLRTTRPLIPGEKKEMLANKRDAAEEATQAPPIRKPQIQYERPPSPRKEETVAAKASPPDMKAGIKERETLSSAPPPGALASRMAQPFLFTVRVQDLKGAGREVEALLNQVGAQRIEKEVFEGKIVFTAMVMTERIEEFRRRLSLFGELKTKTPPPTSPEGDLRIRIEVLPHR